MTSQRSAIPSSLCRANARTVGCDEPGIQRPCDQDKQAGNVLLPWLPALFCLGLLAAPFQQAPAKEPLRILRSVRQIRTLTPEQAHAGVRIHLRGTVMVVPAWRNSFFFSDGQTGISIDRESPDPAVHPGDSVEINGSTGEGQFAPVLNVSQVRIIGRHDLPVAPLVTPADMRNGRLDSQWVAVRGVVRAAAMRIRNSRNQLELSIDVGANTVVAARLTEFPANAAEMLEGATIRVSGICGSAYNTRRQFIAPRFYVTGFDNIYVERPAPIDPFVRPLVPLSGMLRFDGSTSPSEQVHVTGVVTLVRPGQGFYLQQGPDGIFVESHHSPAPVGSSLDVVGYSKSGSYSPILTDAVFRPAPPQPQVSAPFVTSASLLTRMDAWNYAPYDSLLIRLNGKLIDIIPGSKEDLLLIRTGDSLITAKLPGAHATSIPSLLPGSKLLLTGVDSTTVNGSNEAQDTTIFLRSIADIQVIQKAPWWTGIHVWYVIAALTTLLLALLAWNAFTRRESRLRELVARDPLTGLYNRRGFLLMAERQWHQALQNGEQLLVYYIDLDRFKQLNDIMGHKEGDLALQSTANMLRDCFRKSDIIGRLGGDEFAVTALDSPELTANSIRQRLLEGTESFNKRSKQAVELGISLGVLVCDASLSAQPIEELLSKADKLMYAQKRANHVCRT